MDFNAGDGGVGGRRCSGVQENVGACSGAGVLNASKRLNVACGCECCRRCRCAHACA